MKVAICSWTPELQSFFSVPEVHQVVEDSHFKGALITQLGVEAGPILQEESDHFCGVVSVEVKGVKDVGILGQGILFSGLLKEDQDMFRVFDVRCYQPGTSASLRLELVCSMSLK